MTRAFRPVGDNPDLDIHADPPGLWARVAVATMWSDARVGRRKFPHAAVVGPVRTRAGLDELARNLLANPQIRLLIMDGPDLTPEEDTSRALRDLFDPRTRPETYLTSSGLLAQPECTCGGGPEDETSTVLTGKLAHKPLWHVLRDVQLVVHTRGNPERFPRDAAEQWVRANVPDEDRKGGAHVVKADPPKPVGSADHGDPGDRIAGDTLADVFPRLLRQVLVAGHVLSSQYGRAKELLNVVSVIRDPRQTALDYADHAQTTAYYKRLVGAEVPEGAPYSYGSRMRGMELGPDDRNPVGPPVYARRLVDQIDIVSTMLEVSPGTRAAYLTPWRPAEDCGIESNRPCLVGVWFRVTDERLLGEDNAEGQRCMSCRYGEPEADCSVHRKRLHVTIAFRSHDLFKGYPQNLAAVCMWLVDEAERQHLDVGTVTCTSYSGHIYERDWAEAQKVVEGYRRKGLRMDRRSTWRVEVAENVSYRDPREGDHLTMRTIDKTSPDWEFLEAMDTLVVEGFDRPTAITTYRFEGFAGTEVAIVVEHNPYVAQMRFEQGKRDKVGDPIELPRRLVRVPIVERVIRATAHTADGNRVVAVFEGRTAGQLVAQIEEAGLLQEWGHALWLGGELARVEAQLPRGDKAALYEAQARALRGAIGDALALLDVGDSRAASLRLRNSVVGQ